MKRFTETNKWKEPWFRRLSLPAKLLWGYLNDHCDNAGVIDIDLEHASFHIGVGVEEKHLAEFENRFRRLENGKLWLTGFILFQCGKLSPLCRPHMAVFERLEFHGIALEMVEQPDSFIHGITANQRLRIITRDGLVCLYTGEPIASLDLVEVDHFIPQSKGGLNRDDNLFVASKAMNRLRKDKDIEAFCHEVSIPFPLVLERVTERLAKSSENSNRNDLAKRKVLPNCSVTLQDKERDKDKDQAEGVQGKTLGRLALVAGLHRIWQERTGYEATQMTYERMWVDFLDAGHRPPALELVIEHSKVLNKDRDAKYHAPLELGRLIGDLAKFTDRLMAAKAWDKAGRPLELRKESKDEAPRTIPKSEWVKNAL